MVIRTLKKPERFALDSNAFVGDTLARGKLIKPFDLVLENEFAYYAVCLEEHLKKLSVKVFKGWLLAEANLLDTNNGAA